MNTFLPSSMRSGPTMSPGGNASHAPSPMARNRRPTLDRFVTAPLRSPKRQARWRRSLSKPELLALEVRLALLGERLRAFLRVLGGEHGGAVRLLVLERHLLLHAVGLVQRAEDGFDGERTVLADD